MRDWVFSLLARAIASGDRRLPEGGHRFDVGLSDFPGVAPPSERELWAALCPDPNLVLQCRLL